MKRGVACGRESRKAEQERVIKGTCREREVEAAKMHGQEYKTPLEGRVMLYTGVVRVRRDKAMGREGVVTWERENEVEQERLTADGAVALVRESKAMAREGATTLKDREREEAGVITRWIKNKMMEEKRVMADRNAVLIREGDAMEQKRALRGTESSKGTTERPTGGVKYAWGKRMTSWKDVVLGMLDKMR